MLNRANFFIELSLNIRYISISEIDYLRKGVETVNINYDVATHLYNEYCKITAPDITTAIKHNFEYNSVSVSFYYDCYDETAPTAMIILKYNKYLYATQLKIRTMKGYLSNIPKEILNRIKVKESLINFYRELHSVVLTRKGQAVCYKIDDDFISAKTFFRKKENERELPFIAGLRRGNMSDDMEKWLRGKNVKESLITKLKEYKYTVVRTDEIEKRRILITLIEDNIGL